MHSPFGQVQVAAGTADDALSWNLQGIRDFRLAETLVQDVATRLPFFAPRLGLLLLDWTAVAEEEQTLRVRPRIDIHARHWLQVPAAAIRPTGAQVEIFEEAGERQLFLRLSARGGRAGSRVPLATGLMRMSMQAHDARRRFLPVVLSSDLADDHRGEVSLHLHTLDLAEPELQHAVEAGLRKTLASRIAERTLELMAVPGAMPERREGEAPGPADNVLFRF